MHEENNIESWVATSSLQVGTFSHSWSSYYELNRESSKWRFFNEKVSWKESESATVENGSLSTVRIRRTLTGRLSFCTKNFLLKRWNNIKLLSFLLEKYSTSACPEMVDRAAKRNRFSYRLCLLSLIESKLLFLLLLFRLLLHSFSYVPQASSQSAAIYKLNFKFIKL